jgi:uncharacterized membrane protein
MQRKPFFSSRILNFFIVFIVLAIFVTWLAFTPSGLLGKADAVSYAVCHRIASHSFFIGDRQFPLCARDTGMHLGALVGLLFMARTGKKSGMPSKKILLVLGLFLLAFAADGVNSYIGLGIEEGALPPLPFEIHQLYPSQNWLRLLTGSLMGIGISAILYPVFNQTVWAQASKEPALKSWRQLGIVIGLVLFVDMGMLSGIPFLLYPFAILSTLNILIVLTMIYTVIWIMLLKKENTYQQRNQLHVLLAVSFATAILQIGIMDYVRLMLTGTWQGFFV